MNFKCSLLLLVGILFSCSNEEKAIEVVTDEVERGAVVRTTAINATDFDIHDLQSIFHIELEEMDIDCLLYTSPSPRDRTSSRMPSSA